MIHQLYCTHCTHGSSAIERREGGHADRPLGYSVRSGSLAGDELRAAYRRVERFLYYHLPSDTPAELKSTLGPSQAPTRLVFQPDVGGLQVLANISYRTVDSSGRPGSYFAHVIINDVPTTGNCWTPDECLKLWQARKWQTEDSPDFSHDLPPLQSVDDLLDNRAPTIDDDLLESFLRVEREEQFKDPAKLVPGRWKRRSPQERCALLGEMIERSCLTPRKPFFAAAEPGFATLLFYGMARLLPAADGARDASFSTFEPTLNQGGAAWNATTSHDADSARSASAHSRAAVNTYIDETRSFETQSDETQSDETRSDESGPRAMDLVVALAEHGWDAVDARRAPFRLQREEDDARAEASRERQRRQAAREQWERLPFWKRWWRRPPTDQFD